MAGYYYIIAGLPDISFDDSKAAFTVDQFRTQVYDALSGADRKVMDLLLVENECRNFIGSQHMEELIATVKAQEPCPADVPQFMYDFVQEWVDETWREHAALPQDRLWSLFYEYAMQVDNEFVSSWYRFNLDMNNIQTAITARKYDLDIQKVIVGSGDTAQALSWHIPSWKALRLLC